MSLADFIATAWNEHGDAPEAVAERLSDAPARLADAADVAPLASLVAHVFGEHLGRWGDGLALLQRLHDHPAADTSAKAAIARAAATLQHARGDADALGGLPTDERAAALAGSAAMLAGRGDPTRAGEALQTALDTAAAGLPDGSPALRALAVAGNNIAAALEEQPSRSAGETALMLRAAETGLAFWPRAGGWLQHERAAYRLASSRLAAGDPEGALASARQCLSICEANDAPPFERFFAQALIARASRAAGDADGSAAARAAALACHERMPVDEQAWCADELAALKP